MLVYFWLFLVFVIGVVVGSFLNVAIARLPMEKSLLWPGSRCGQCFRAIRWYDNIPLVSYLWLGGRCRSCGAAYSMRYFWVELITGLGFVGLFYVEVVLNVHRWPTLNAPIQFGFFPWQWWAGFFFHAILFSFLMVASVTDLEGREIPFSLTITGAIIGLIGAVLMPWPWPHLPQDAIPAPLVNPNLPNQQWLMPDDKGESRIGRGVYPWPVWIPGWLPAGQWPMGLATGLAGLLVGTLMLRAVSFLASKGLGKEALGLGDADLMMMAGCFLGWQVVAVAFFVSVGPALVFGLCQYFINKDNELPFGPSLAAGLMITLLCWRRIGAYVQPVMFYPEVLLALVGFGAAMMFGLTFLLRVLRGPADPAPVPPRGG